MATGFKRSIAPKTILIVATIGNASSSPHPPHTNDTDFFLFHHARNLFQREWFVNRPVPDENFIMPKNNC